MSEINLQTQRMAQRLDPVIWPMLVRRFYAEADWTPTYTGATTPGTTTYSATGQRGTYVRQGGLITVNGLVEWSGATGTGNARISLPVAARAASPVRQWPVILRISFFTYAGDGVQAFVRSGTDYFELESYASNAAPTTLAVENNGLISFTAIYLVDDGVPLPVPDGARITEAGDVRITEAGDTRIIE